MTSNDTPVMRGGGTALVLQSYNADKLCRGSVACRGLRRRQCGTGVFLDCLLPLPFAPPARRAGRTLFVASPDVSRRSAGTSMNSERGNSTRVYHHSI